jgi:iron complex outermembrane receptor protein
MCATDLRLCPLGLAAMIAFVTPAFAQAPGADLIVVTATRQAESADVLPQSVTVLSGSDRDAVDGAENIVRRLAGVQAAIPNGSQTTFQIRGVGAVDHEALRPSAAAVHVDGVFLATDLQASLLAYELARVAVLKGLQGAIQGRDASSGSINFTTAIPTDEPEAYFDVSCGRFYRRDVSVAASG